MGLPKSHHGYHLEGFRIISSGNGECSMLSRAAEVKGGRRTWQPRVSHTRAALLIWLHDRVASGLCKETRMPRATASQSLRVEPRQLFFPMLPKAPSCTARVGKTLYTGMQRGEQGRGRVEVLHRPNIKITWGL